MIVLSRSIEERLILRALQLRGHPEGRGVCLECEAEMTDVGPNEQGLTCGGCGLPLVMGCEAILAVIPTMLVGDQ